MPEGIADCLPHFALRKVLWLELDQIIFEALEDRFGLTGSDDVTQGGACSAPPTLPGLFAEAFFYAIEVPDKFHDERGMALSCFEGLVKFSPNMGHATTQCSVAVGLLVTAVGAVAITLKRAFIVGTKSVGEIASGSIGTPVVAEASGGVVVAPKIGGGGFAFTGLQET